MAELFRTLVPFGTGEEIVRYVTSAVPSGARVLELGCGYGRILSALADAGYRCTGVEASAELVELARRSLPASVQLLHGDALEVEVNGCFDAVLLVGATLTLLTPHSQQRLLARAADLLVPGGVLVVDGHDPAWVRARHVAGALSLDYGIGQDAVVATSALTERTWHTSYARRAHPDEPLAHETHHLLGAQELRTLVDDFGLVPAPVEPQSLGKAGYLVMFERQGVGATTGSALHRAGAAR